MEFPSSIWAYPHQCRQIQTPHDCDLSQHTFNSKYHLKVKRRNGHDPAASAASVGNDRQQVNELRPSLLQPREIQFRVTSGPHRGSKPRQQDPVSTRGPMWSNLSCVRIFRMSHKVTYRRGFCHPVGLPSLFKIIPNRKNW